MPRLNLDWSYIKRSAAISVPIFLVTLALWWLSYTTLDSVRQEYHQVRGHNTQLQAQIARLNEDASIIKQYHADFLALSNRGVLDQDHRLEWISRFRLGARQLKLATARFQILPRAPADINQIQAAAPVNILVSRMKFQAELLHEGDLVSLLRQLDSALGQYHVTACELKRVHDKMAMSAAASNLFAQCDLDFFTVSTRLNEVK